MRPTEPLPLYHSWPLAMESAHFAEGLLLDGPGVPSRHIHWRCDLPGNRLTWTTAVYALFGMPPGVTPDRDYAVRCYDWGSRDAMERLRAYAIKHRRGFTLDVEIGPPAGRRRWVRLIASPVLNGRDVVALEGLKIPLSA